MPRGEKRRKRKTNRVKHTYNLDYVLPEQETTIDGRELSFNFQVAHKQPIEKKCKEVEAKTENQHNYIRAIIENDIIFCSGPAGCGKSYVAAGMAASHLSRSITKNIVASRPLVCTGSNIGALPGDLSDKIAPYLGPVEENLKYFLGRTHYGRYINEYHIKYKPIELMRGATYNDSYMILDEAQNCTKKQITMFLARMGKNSKVLINGDIKQNDLKGQSGLAECMEKLSGINGVGICKLDYHDIQRHGILGTVLQALED